MPTYGGLISKKSLGFWRAWTVSRPVLAQLVALVDWPLNLATCLPSVTWSAAPMVRGWCAHPNAVHMRIGSARTGCPSAISRAVARRGAVI
jgi:hypothetical protein